MSSGQVEGRIEWNAWAYCDSFRVVRKADNAGCCCDEDDF
jgi:hypothetical protein